MRGLLLVQGMFIAKQHGLCGENLPKGFQVAIIEGDAFYLGALAAMSMLSIGTTCGTQKRNIGKRV